MEPVTHGSLATPEEVATYLGTTGARLAKMRMAGTGPMYIKDGRRVLYRWSAVEQYLQENTRVQTSRA